eukprot:244001-Pleurochrysis_carterae.AAC.1
MADPIGFRLLAVLTSMLEIFGALYEQKESWLISFEKLLFGGSTGGSTGASIGGSLGGSFGGSLGGSFG